MKTLTNNNSKDGARLLLLSRPLCAGTWAMFFLTSSRILVFVLLVLPALLSSLCQATTNLNRASARDHHNGRNEGSSRNLSPRDDRRKSRRHRYGRNLQSSSSGISVEINGSELLTVPAVPYIPSQDSQADGSFGISDDRSSLTLRGNAWKAFGLGGLQYVVTDQTVLAFDWVAGQLASHHAICLEGSNLEKGQANNCFRLGGTAPNDASLFRMQIAPPLNSNSYRIQVGKYFHSQSERPISALAFVSDTEANGQEEAQSSFSNIRLFEDDNLPSLTIEVNGEDFTVAAPSFSYATDRFGNAGEDNGGGWYTLSRSGKAITLFGNIWKGFFLNAYEITDQTVLEFQIRMTQITQQHVICLDGENRRADSMVDNCFYLGGTELDTDWTMRVDPPVFQSDNRRSIRIEVGRRFYSASEKTVNVIVFASDSDAVIDFGETTFSNIRLYEDTENLQNLELEISGETIVVPGSSFSVATDRFGNGGEDNGGGWFETDATSLTMMGNAWKGFFIPAYAITDQTVLQFDIQISQLTEQHIICLDSDEDRRADMMPDNCFFLGGTELGGDWRMRVLPQVAQSNDNVRTITLEVGRRFHRESDKLVSVIAFGHDSDANRAVGKTTFSNIRLFEDKSLRNLRLNIRGNSLIVATSSVSIATDRFGNGGEDNGGGRFETKRKGKTITLFGNAWKGFRINDYPVTDQTVFECKVLISQLAEQHVLCLEGGDLRADFMARNCFYLGGTEVGDWTMRVQPQVSQDDKRTIRIEVGRRFYASSDKTVNVIGFASDSDAAPVTVGETTFSNLRLFEDNSLRNLQLTVNGKVKSVLGSSFSYATDRFGNGGLDNGGGWFETRQKGKTISLYGNALKAFSIDAYTVTENTILEFDFVIDEIASQHAICLDSSNLRSDLMVHNCFFLGGIVDGDWTMRLEPLAAEGDAERRYVVPVGQLFGESSENPVTVIALVSENSENRSGGKSTFRNIAIYEGEGGDVPNDDEDDVCQACPCP